MVRVAGPYKSERHTQRITKRLSHMRKLKQKTCTRCGTLKKIGAFGIRGRYRTHIHSWCKNCCVIYQMEYRLRNKRRLSRQKIEYTRNAKREGLKEYGGKCSCCGEERYQFLTLDHINGRDKAVVRETGTRAWARLRCLGWPKDGYQILCFNCNCAKGIYGECPHRYKDPI